MKNRLAARILYEIADLLALDGVAFKPQAYRRAAQGIESLTTAIEDVVLTPVLDGPAINSLQEIIRRVPVADHVIEYAMRLVRATRLTESDIPDVVRNYVSWGAGPRACQYLIMGGKVRAILHGRYHVSTDDIQAVAKPVLRHRLVTNFNADAEGYTTDRIVDRLLEIIPARESPIAANPATAKAVRQEG